jgi:Uri superfamily endonuclease
MKGTYILLIKLKKPARLRVGKLGTIKFGKGYYAYVGSGMNSLEARISRHMKKRGKKKFWHIDYFLSTANALGAISWESVSRDECGAAGSLSGNFEPVRGFGSSDCGCESHLFFSEKLQPIENAAAKIRRSSLARQRPLRFPRS